MNQLYPRLLATTLAGVLLFIMASACFLVPPTDAQMAGADYGTPISQEDAEAEATTWLESALNDPDELNVAWKPVVKGWHRSLLTDPYFGYKLRATANSKKYVFLFFNEELAHAWKQDDAGLYMVKEK